MLEYDERFNQVQSCRSGTSVIIDINFTGHPDPSVEWFFNGTPLTASGVQASAQTDASHTGLTVKNIRPNEAGLYKVKVSNKAGSKTATFTIEVKGISNSQAINKSFNGLIIRHAKSQHVQYVHYRSQTRTTVCRQ